MGINQRLIYKNSVVCISPMQVASSGATYIYRANETIFTCIHLMLKASSEFQSSGVGLVDHMGCCKRGFGA